MSDETQAYPVGARVRVAQHCKSSGGFTGQKGEIATHHHRTKALGSGRTIKLGYMVKIPAVSLTSSYFFEHDELELLCLTNIGISVETGYATHHLTCRGCGKEDTDPTNNIVLTFGTDFCAVVVLCVKCTADLEIDLGCIARHIKHTPVVPTLDEDCPVCEGLNPRCGCKQGEGE